MKVKLNNALYSIKSLQFVYLIIPCNYIVYDSQYIIGCIFKIHPMS